MSMEESRARLRASSANHILALRDVESWWFRLSDLQDFIEQLDGADPETGQFYVYPGLNEDDEIDLHLEVKEHDAVIESCGDPLNCSHVCPPDCSFGPD